MPKTAAVRTHASTLDDVQAPRPPELPDFLVGIVKTPQDPRRRGGSVYAKTPNSGSAARSWELRMGSRSVRPNRESGAGSDGRAVQPVDTPQVFHRRVEQASDR